MNKIAKFVSVELYEKLKNLVSNDDIVIVIPAYNEADRIESVLSRTHALYNRVVVVDDCSTDDTSRVAKEAGAKVITLEQNRGAGYATRVGCDYAFYELGAKVVITIDADGQHAPEDIHLLVDKLFEEDLDIVYGYRPRSQIVPVVKWLGNFILSTLSYFLFRIRVTDTLTGFHAFSSKNFNLLKWESDRYEFVSEFSYLIYKHSLKYGEVAIQTIYNDKLAGMRKRDGIRSILRMLGWRFPMLNFFKSI